MAKTMRVLVKAPGKDPEVREIPNTLKAMQEVVGGLIEFLSFNGLGEHFITVYCNEDGKYDDRCVPNVKLPLWTGVHSPDVLCGAMLFCGSTEDADDRSLTAPEEAVAREWLGRLESADPGSAKPKPDIQIQVMPE